MAIFNQLNPLIVCGWLYVMITNQHAVHSTQWWITIISRIDEFTKMKITRFPFNLIVVPAPSCWAFNFNSNQNKKILKFIKRYLPRSIVSLLYISCKLRRKSSTLCLTRIHCVVSINVTYYVVHWKFKIEHTFFNGGQWINY